MAISKKNAKSLAVSYQAYIAAFHASDDNGLVTWGEILLGAQERTGVELHTPDSISYRVERSRRNLRREAEALAEANATLAALDPSQNTWKREAV